MLAGFTSGYDATTWRLYGSTVHGRHCSAARPLKGRRPALEGRPAHHPSRVAGSFHNRVGPSKSVMATRRAHIRGTPMTRRARFVSDVRDRFITAFAVAGLAAGCSGGVTADSTGGT